MKYYGRMKVFGKTPSHHITSTSDTLAKTRCGIYLNKRFLEKALSTDKHCKTCRMLEQEARRYG